MKYRQKPITSILQTFQGHLSKKFSNKGIQHIYIEYGKFLFVISCSCLR